MRPIRTSSRDFGKDIVPYVVEHGQCGCPSLQHQSCVKI